MTPSSSPTFARAETSSRLTEASSSSPAKRLPTKRISSTNGYITTCSMEMPLVVKPIRLRYLLVPMVLGMISEQTRIRMVVSADIHPTQ